MWVVLAGLGYVFSVRMVSELYEFPLGVQAGPGDDFAVPDRVWLQSDEGWLPNEPFTVTSHIIITFAMAMTVFLTVIIYGFWRNGLGFLKLFVPEGVPGVLRTVFWRGS